MSDHDEIAALTSRLGLLVDARDWEALEGLFCGRVDLDYTSLRGGEPQQLSAADVVGGWRANLEPLAATHHLIANHVINIDGDSATVAAIVTATHLARDATGDRLWTVGGRYELRTVREEPGWRIAALKLIVRWATGNQAIMGGG